MPQLAQPPLPPSYPLSAPAYPPESQPQPESQPESQQPPQPPRQPHGRQNTRSKQQQPVLLAITTMASMANIARFIFGRVLSPKWIVLATCATVASGLVSTGSNDQIGQSQPPTASLRATTASQAVDHSLPVSTAKSVELNKSTESLGLSRRGGCPGDWHATVYAHSGCGNGELRRSRSFFVAAGIHLVSPRHEWLSADGRYRRGPIRRR